MAHVQAVYRDPAGAVPGRVKSWVVHWVTNRPGN